MFYLPTYGLSPASMLLANLFTITYYLKYHTYWMLAIFSICASYIFVAVAHVSMMVILKMTGKLCIINPYISHTSDMLTALLVLFQLCSLSIQNIATPFGNMKYLIVLNSLTAVILYCIAICADIYYSIYLYHKSSWTIRYRYTGSGDTSINSNLSTSIQYSKIPLSEREEKDNKEFLDDLSVSDKDSDKNQ